MSDTAIRIDKWLWYARFFKTRTLAAKVVSSGGVRVDGTHVRKPSAMVKVSDTLTFSQEKDIRVVQIVALGTRRGPAPEAQALYSDLAPVVRAERTAPDTHPGQDRSGRPTKKSRRDLDAFRKTPT